MSGIPDLTQGGTPARLRRAARALGAVAAVSWGLGIAGARSQEAGVHRLVLAVALSATTTAAGCWINSIRGADERRAVARLLAELSGEPEPTHDRLRAV